jgi:hypothetical protein
MNSRRSFFRDFVGHSGMLLDEFKGVELIPLNRLKELPQDIVEQIVPVFFPEESWELKTNILSIPQYNRGKGITIELKDNELKALQCFKQQVNLKETALCISTGSVIPFDEVYENVTSLFFRLASMRICHPREIYRINELDRAKKI